MEREQKSSNTGETKNVEVQTELAKAQVEMAKVQVEAQRGWQEVVKDVSDKLERYNTQKTGSARRYTTTLTIGILVFLLIITSMLAILTWNGFVGGESLLFFLGTLAGSALMLLAERIRSEE